MSRFVHLADLHLGAACSFLSADRQKQRKQDLVDSFNKAVDYICRPDNTITGVIIAGDLFDNLEPDPELVHIVKKAFKDLKDRSRIVVLCPGTHDPSIYPESVYRKYDFPEVIILNEPNPGKPVTVAAEGNVYYFYGMEYNPLLTEKPFGAFERNGSSGIHIGVVHGSFKTADNWATADRYMPLEPEILEKTGLDYIALGHYHNFNRYDLGKVTAVYPGTLEGLNFKETGNRFLTVVDFGSGSGVSIEKILWNKRILQEVFVNLSRDGLEKEEDIINAIEKNCSSGENCIYRVHLKGSGEFDIDTDEINRKLSGKFFHIDIVDETSFFKSSNIDNWKHENSVRGLFIRKMLEKMKNADEKELKSLEYAMRNTVSRMQGGEMIEV